jgi:hypothetical protein
MSKLGFAPTDEQEACIEAFGTGENIVIIAGAGAAKTTTCQLMSEVTKDRGSYIAYNSSIAGEAKSKFPRHVICKTSHGFAFGSVGKDYRHKITNGAATPARELVRFLKISSPFKLPSDAMIAPWALARMARDTVQRFCYSADRQITKYHIPFTPGAEEVREELAALVIPWANRIWQDYENLRGTLVWGRSHDPYLKMAQLRGLKLPGEFFMLDEAQDTNACVQDIFENQDGQLIAVGDANQQLYAWRGAEDYMSKMQAEHRLTLSKSFRFGPAVAEEANKWLTLLDSELRIEGFDQIKSVVHSIEVPDAVLCRTNAETIGQAMHFHEQNKSVGIVGGTGEIKRLAESAIALQSGQPASHPDMIAFKTWGEFKEYVEEEGGDHQTFVRIVDTYGAPTVLQVADQCVDDRYADVVISTGHKAKGREWGKVKIGNDFQPPEDSETGEEGMPSRPEMMLAYVAVTRAKNELDTGSLDWVNNYLKPTENQPLSNHPEVV